MGETRVQITDTILRDAHQSLIATRMRTEDMLPALELLDDVGYFSLEMWGGATFDVCMRFLNENPWERLRTIRKHVKKTKLQMLLRGQNAVGYRHYADDVVYAFVDHAAENGIDVFRIFDALNDIRNLAPAMRAVKKAGKHVEGSISYTISPAHTTAGFVAFGQQLKDEGADTICIKDMAGLVSPAIAKELIGALNEQVGLPVHLHTHCASGMAPATYFAAAEAGVAIIDCALSPFSWGTAQPPTESIVGALAGTPWDTGLDLDKLSAAAEHFQTVRERYLPLLNPISERVDTRILHHQIPGGMLSNLLSQLQQQKASDKFDDVLKETARVREDLGFPPLVTPTSQIVGTQAVFNVVAGERYKIVTKEVANYLRGLYGRAPAPVNEALQKKVLGDEKPTAERPAEGMEPEMQGCLEHAEREWGGGLEEALCYAMFPPVATEFFDARKEGRVPATTEPPPEELAAREESAAVDFGPEARELTLRLDGVESVVKVADAAGGGLRVALDGVTYAVDVQAKSRRRQRSAGDAEAGGGEGTLRAPMPGTLLELKVAEGDEVEQGQIVAVLEAMKMQNELEAPVAGTIIRVFADQGQNLDMTAPILEIEPPA